MLTFMGVWLQNMGMPHAGCKVVSSCTFILLQENYKIETNFRNKK